MVDEKQQNEFPFERVGKSKVVDLPDGSKVRLELQKHKESGSQFVSLAIGKAFAKSKNIWLPALFARDIASEIAKFVDVSIPKK